jgi:hypothetical protein
MKKLIILSSLVLSVAGVQAGESPFQASLTPDIAVQSKATQINGVCLSIWGENPQHALALGIINGSTGSDSQGLSWAFIANYSDTYTGIDLGMVNWSKVKFTGVQWGAVNVANEFHGLQLGWVNYAENLRGLQLGFVNVARNNSWFKEMPDKLATGFPIVNWSF